MSNQSSKPWLDINSQSVKRATWKGDSEPSSPSKEGKLIIHFHQGQISYSGVPYGWYILISSMLEEDAGKKEIERILSAVAVEIESEKTEKDIGRIQSVLDLSNMEVVMLKRLCGAVDNTVSNYGIAEFESSVLVCTLAAFILHKHRNRSRKSSWSRAGATISRVTEHKIEERYAMLTSEEVNAMEQVLNFSAITQDRELPISKQNNLDG